MPKSITLNLDKIEKGYFIGWQVTSQTSRTGTVSLKAGGKEYFNLPKSGTANTYQVVGQGSADFGGEGKLTLTIDFTEASPELKACVNASAIIDASANTVGFNYGVYVEDGGDNDYNDIYVNIVGWAKKG